MSNVISLIEYKRETAERFWQEVWMLSDSDLRLAIYMVKQAIEDASERSDHILQTKEFTDWMREFMWAVRHHAMQPDFHAGYQKWRASNA